jgi:hypothetical protein
LIDKAAGIRKTGDGLAVPATSVVGSYVGYVSNARLTKI